MAILNMLARGGPVRSTLSISGFRLLWISGLFRSVGQWMDLVVLGWLVLEMTGSPFDVAKVSFFRMIPLAISGPFGGVIADRFSRKRIMLGTVAISVVAASTLATLIYLEVVQIWHISLIALALGVSFSLNNPARRSTIHDMVGDRLLVNAMSVDQIGFTISRIVGPLAGGILLKVASAGAAFTAVAVLHAIAFIPLFMMVAPPMIKRVASSTILQDLIEGFKYALKDPVIRGILAITIVWNILVFPFIQLMPVFAKDVLDVGPTLFGLMGTMSGVGQMIGTLTLASSSSIKRPGILFIGGATLFGIGTFWFALSQWYPVSLVLLMVLGVGQAVYFVLQTSLILLVASSEMRGRAMGVLTLCIGAGPLGTLLIGFLAEQWGVSTAVAGAAALALVLMAVITLSMPAVARISRSS